MNYKIKILICLSSLSLFLVNQLMACDEHGVNDSLKTPIVQPWVMAHRGASGYFPEHTLMAYIVAVQQGADYIEPDLVMTKDGVLIARHENEISSTTNVADIFPSRKTTKIIDGDTIAGWFSEDFTLSEIKQLRAVERLPFRSHEADGKYEIPTLEEIIEIVHQLSDLKMKAIGIVPEIKHSTYFHSVGFHIEDSLLKIFNIQQLPSLAIPVMIQSFEVSNLKYLKSRCNIPLLQLLGDPFEMPFDLKWNGKSITYKDLASNEALLEMAKYASAIGIPKDWLLFTVDENAPKPVSNWINTIHDVGLKVILYTFRNEEKYIDGKFKGQMTSEIDYFLQLGIDAFFTDFPDIAYQRKVKFILK